MTLRYWCEKAYNLSLDLFIMTDIEVNFERVNCIHPNNDNIINESYFPNIGPIYPTDCIKILGGDSEDYKYCTTIPGIYYDP